MLEKRIVTFLFYPNYNKSEKIYYLLRKDPKTNLKKFTGFREEINEENEIMMMMPFKIEDELGYLPAELNLKKQGIVQTKELEIHILKGNLSRYIGDQLQIKTKIGYYKSLDYHKIKPEMFPELELLYLDKLIFTNEEISLQIYDKNIE